ncbi:hypothetical protein GSY69_01690 [Brevibacterium sp. 5221]|uniref:Uncharacterized protein n=1 Tax=Brevibacterium rongguiense TaxID=2695267 RepID=A0A6N9H4X0_9MICO|nr:MULTISPECIES: hypothetical protein [Brevibacterium]MYM18722.1 hypothetical protein [Brevibacterium rongguiense]WAL40212.1 hypothetical protein BRM1_13460 [Brevibacterium sp. BRM-1]
MPLGIGFAVIALALIVLAALVTDIYLAQRRLYALADSAALAAADSFEPAETAEPDIELSDSQVDRAAQSFAQRTFRETRWSGLQVRGSTDDGHSANVEIRGTYHSALLSPFAPRGIELRAGVTARGGLRR